MRRLGHKLPRSVTIGGTIVCSLEHMRGLSPKPSCGDISYTVVLPSVTPYICNFMEYFLQPIDRGEREPSRVYAQLVHWKWTPVVVLSHSEVAPEEDGEEKSYQGQNLKHCNLMLVTIIVDDIKWLVYAKHFMWIISFNIHDNAKK